MTKTKEMTRQEWLDNRKNYIGASEVAAILGVSPHMTALKVYRAKVFGENDYDRDWMAFGRDVEGAIANLYARRTGRQVIDLGATVVSMHPDVPFLGATLDRQTVDESSEVGPLELKHVGGFDISKKGWFEDPPVYYKIQTQTQTSCTSAKWGVLAGMFPGCQLAHKKLDYNAEFIKRAIPLLEKFWKCVVDKTPPKVKDHRDLPAIKEIYSGENIGSLVSLSESDMHIVAQWEKAKKDSKDAQKRKAEAEAKLRERMKEATFGRLLDGTFISLKTTNREGYTKEVAPSSFRTLRHAKTMK